MTVTATSATTSTAGSTSSSTSSSSLSSLTSNFSDFLNLLMTQLQNQDPTSPMDTNTFTSQLVQYASVEQQINTNTNLNTLITATQSNAMLQSGSIVGKQAQVTSDHASLQDGSATVGFNTPTAQRVSIGIYSDAGVKLYEASMDAKAGDNTWKWDGTSSTDQTLDDGSYKVVVADSTGTALSTTTTGKVTGMQKSGNTVNLSLGGLTAPIGNVQSISD
jgi:flagellar basal-body rod modification protein FlgD